MRSVFVFPAFSRREVSEIVRAHGVRPDLDPQTSEDGDSQTMWAQYWSPLGPPDWETADLDQAAEYLGRPAEWAIETTVSGRIDGRDEVHALVADLLADGGCATNFAGELFGAERIRSSGSGAWLG